MARTLQYIFFVFAVSISQTNADDLSTKEVIAGLNNFSFNLFKEINSSNVISSGYCVSTVLTMLLIGARNKTAQEIQTVLGNNGLTMQQVEGFYRQVLKEQNNNNYSDFEMVDANSIWIQKGFNVLQEFEDEVQRHFYYEQVKVVDFANNETTDRINQWANNATKGKIPKLFENPLEASNRLLLANTLYFNGTWLNKFNTKSTVEGPFYINGRGNNKPVKMMSTFADFPYADVPQLLDAQVLELPYGGRIGSMVVILPKTRDGLELLLKNLTIDILNEVLQDLKTSKVHVKLPKFSISSRIPLNDILKRLGMSTAFDQKTADLSGIDGKRDLYVSKAIQSAMIEVNEEGTVAATANAAAAANSWKTKEFYFTANHPFIFLIRNTNYSLFYFMGKFTEP